MFANLLKLTLRNMYKDRLYSFINLFGLAVSFACFLMIFLYLRSELTYHKHFADHERIYRLTASLGVDGRQTEHAKVGSMVGPLLAQDYAQFADVVRLESVGAGTLILNDGISRMWDNEQFRADNSILEIFGLSVLSGGTATALTEPKTIAISESMARFYFGGEDPVGKSLGIQIAANKFTVDLVFADLPANTSHRFDMLFSNVDSELTVDAENFFENGIARFNSYTFFRVPADYDPESFSRISADFA